MDTPNHAEAMKDNCSGGKNMKNKNVAVLAVASTLLAQCLLRHKQKSIFGMRLLAVWAN